MRKIIRFISSFLFTGFCIISCGASVVQPLTKEGNKKLLQNPHPNQEELKIGIFYGCVHVPATGVLQKMMVGFERTGESCSVTVGENNAVKVSFLRDVVTSVVNTSTDQYRTDIFIGELENNQVIIVQHHQGVVVSVTQTVYDKKGDVVYGKSGQGDYIKECHLGMATFERLSGKKNCGK